MERIRSLWERILSFKRSSHFEMGPNCGESLPDTVLSLCNFFSALATPLSCKVACMYVHCFVCALVYHPLTLVCDFISYLPY